jgi:Ca2+-binding RTX toxin-like protein
MSARQKRGRRRLAGVVRAGATAGAVAVAVSVLPAGVAAAGAGGVSASFNAGTLVVTGTAAGDTIVVSRNAAGAILVNAGAVPIAGGTPTVANTAAISVFGLGGNDILTLDEAAGALPIASLIGASGNDTLTGGSGADVLAGQAGIDALLGKGGTDLLLGGGDNDTLTGGDADDQAFGQAGADRMIWNPGDDTDLNEGGDGADITEVVGGNGAEQFTETANGTRVRFDRLNPAPFAIDMGTTENLVLRANGGDDSFSATGNLAGLIFTTVDGGDGNDTLLGTNAGDLLFGSAGDDFADGQQGNDVAFLGDDDDSFQWDPGDGSDRVEGQVGADTMVFNGSNANEAIDVSANGARARLFRDVGAVTMDTDDVERFDIRSLGGTDTVTVNDLTGTDVSEVRNDLAAVGGGDDAAADNVIVAGTNDDDAALVLGQGAEAQVSGLSALVSVVGANPASDRLTVSSLAGDDVVDASDVAAPSLLLTLNGGADDDVLVGGPGNDTMFGEDGDDVLIGGPGLDTLDGGSGSNVVIQD